MYIRKRAGAFAFLVHPRSLDDFFNWQPAKVILDQSSNIEEFINHMSKTNPTVISDITFGFSGIRGELISVPLLPDAINSANGIDLIKQAVQLAINRGVSVIGLGALTSPASGAGQQLLSMLPANVTLTTGNAFTAIVISKNIDEAMSLVPEKSNTRRVAIIGCTGSVGSLLTKILAEKGIPLLLIGRSKVRVENMFGGLTGDIIYSDTVESCISSDIIVTLTNDHAAKLKPIYAKDNAFIIDAAQPRNILAEETDAFLAKGIKIAEGGVVLIPEFECSYNFGFSNRHTTFACLAETYLFAKEGIRSNSTGRASMNIAKLVESAAEKNKVSVRQLFN